MSVSANVILRSKYSLLTALSLTASIRSVRVYNRCKPQLYKFNMLRCNQHYQESSFSLSFISDLLVNTFSHHRLTLPSSSSSPPSSKTIPSSSSGNSNVTTYSTTSTITTPKEDDVRMKYSARLLSCRILGLRSISKRREGGRELMPCWC